jgi:hypothetical protein
MQVLARERSRVYAAIILLSFLGAAWIAVERLQVEKESNRAGIVIDFYATRQLASEAGRPLADLLRDFRGAGAWGVALEELTVSQAAREGQLMLLDGNEAGPALQAMGLGAVPVSETHTYVVWWPEGTPQWLALSLRLHLEPWATTVAKGRGLVVWEIQARPPTEGFAGVPVSAAAVAHLGLGLSETAVRVIRQAGLAVVPRFLHSPTLTAANTSRITRGSAVALEPMWLLTPTTPGTERKASSTTASISALSIWVVISLCVSSKGPLSGSIGKCRRMSNPTSAARSACLWEKGRWGNTATVSGAGNRRKLSAASHP